MFKRNDGYALSYVLVVLMVLAIIATAVMAPPMRNLQMQQASIERMKDKYIAQGMVEQVVAQLTPTSDINSIKQALASSNGISVEDIKLNADGSKYTVEIKLSSTTITTEFTLSEVYKKDTEGNLTSEILGYQPIYISYNTQEVANED